MVLSGGSRRGPSLSFPRRAPPRRSGHLARPRAPRCRRPTLAPDESSRSVRDGVRVGRHDGARRGPSPATKDRRGRQLRRGRAPQGGRAVRLRAVRDVRERRRSRRWAPSGHPTGCRRDALPRPRRRRHRGARRLSRDAAVRHERHRARLGGSPGAREGRREAVAPDPGRAQRQATERSDVPE